MAHNVINGSPTGPNSGQIALGVRIDSDISPVTSDGNYHFNVYDSAGNLKVNIKKLSAGSVTFSNNSITISNTSFTISNATILSVSEWSSTAMNSNDGYAVLPSAANNKHFILYHISVNNSNSSDSNFQIQDGSGGSVFREYTVAKNGGSIEAQFNPPVAFSSTSSFWYNWISGTGTNINLSFHYREVDD